MLNFSSTLLKNLDMSRQERRRLERKEREEVLHRVELMTNDKRQIGILNRKLAQRRTQMQAALV